MRIGITGAGGYIGGSLRNALEKDHQVTGFDRFLSDRPGDVTLDVCDREAVIHRINRIDILFHKVGLMGCGRSHHHPSAYYRTNVKGTLNVLEACRQNGVRKIVFDSTESVFGPENNSPLEETLQPVPASLYSASKYIAEQYIEAFCRQHGMRYAILRYPRVVSRSSRMVVNRVLSAALDGKPLTITDNGLYRFDLVHLSDVMRANIAMIDFFEAQGIFHVSGMEPLSVMDICDIVERTTKTEIRRRFADDQQDSDGRYLPNPLYLGCSRLARELGAEARITSSEAVRLICKDEGPEW